MTKRELLRETARRAGVPIAQARKILEASSAIMLDALASGETITIRQLATVGACDRRITGRDFRTGRQMPTRVRRDLSVSLSDKVISALNKGR